MLDSFHPIEYLDYLRRRWAFSVAVVGAAVLTAAGACLLSPNRYTATATIIIEPPGTNDPRTGVSVSSVYLESLKSYEQFASSDSLFAKACEKFHLLGAGGSPSIESLKRRVLRVEKLKDTKLLEVSVTLPNPQQAQAMAQYLAEETTALSRGLARDDDQRLIDDARKQTDGARTELDRIRTEIANAASGPGTTLEEETTALGLARTKTAEQLQEADALVAELSAREAAMTAAGAGDPASAELEYLRPQLAGVRGRQKTLSQEAANLDKQFAEKSMELGAVRARRERARSQLPDAEAHFNEVQRRLTDLVNTAGLRTEQLRVVDPGIVPQRPSFPNVPLFLAAAIGLGLIASLAWLSLQFTLSRQRARVTRTELRVARKV